MHSLQNYRTVEAFYGLLLEGRSYRTSSNALAERLVPTFEEMQDFVASIMQGTGLILLGTS